MKLIYKYQIPYNANNFSIYLPKDSKFLSAKIQFKTDDFISVWYEVNPYPNESIRDKLKCFKFKCFATGESINNEELDNFEFVDTFLFNDGAFVIHMYRKDENE